jgi:hypothetical protein
MQGLEIQRAVFVDREQEQPALLVPQQQVLGECARQVAAQLFSILSRSTIFSRWKSER